MISDLNYKESANKHTLCVTTDQQTPDLLKRAITLMLFSEDEEIRNFNGSSVVNIFPTLTEAGVGAIQFYLASAASRIKNILQTIDNSVEEVYFDCENAGKATLQVTLNIVVAGNIQTTVVYGE